MLSVLVSLIFVVFSSCVAFADCSKQSLSCSLDPTFLKESQELYSHSQEKIEALLENQDFKSFLADIKEAPSSLKQTSTSAQLFVFVSFSMGEKALLNLAREAKLTGATLILRGFKDNSLKKTVSALYKVILATGQGVSIDPELFKIFKVIAVPTFVLTTGSMHDHLQGHVSLAYALEMFAKGGDLKQEAQTLTNKGRRP